jgi:hypothetical protein
MLYDLSIKFRGIGNSNASHFSWQVEPISIPIDLAWFPRRPTSTGGEFLGSRAANEFQPFTVDIYAPVKEHLPWIRAVQEGGGGISNPGGDAPETKREVAATL